MFSRIFKLSQYTDAFEYHRAGMIIRIQLITLSVYLFYLVLVPSVLYAPRTLLQYFIETESVLDFIFLAIVYITGLSALYFARIGNLKIASWLTLICWAVMGIGNTFDSGFVNPFLAIVVVATAIIGGLVVGRRGLVVGFWLTILGIALGTLLRPTLTDDMLPPYIVSVEAIVRTRFIDFGALSLATFIITSMIWLFLRYADIARDVGATEAVQIRADVGQIVTDLTQRVAQRISVQDLADYTVDRILKDFDRIYHAQIFLIDETRVEAQLIASTGEVGKQLIARSHGLKVGSQSVIGQVTYLGKYIVAQAGSTDSIHKRNELLPDTAVEAAFALRIGDRVIGALDLQSKDRDAFNREDLAGSFQTLADSIGLAIDNIRQFESAEQRLKDNERLVQEARDALRQVERLNERLTGRIWSDYLSGVGHEISMAVDFENQQTTNYTPSTESITEAIKSHQLVQSQTDDAQIIAVPLRVRGRVVGAMEFDLADANRFSPDDLDLLQEVAERFGIAVENVRLVDESQRTAQREAYVNQIVGRLQTMNTIEDMVTEAARGLQDALKAQKIAVKLGTPPR